MDDLHPRIKAQQAWQPRISQKARHRRICRRPHDVGEAEDGQHEPRRLPAKAIAVFFDLDQVPYGPGALAAPQSVFFGQEGRVARPRAIDGGAALQDHLAHARIGAGAKQVGRAHHVQVKSSFARLARLHKGKMADGIHLLRLQQVRQQCIAHVGLDKVQIPDSFGRHFPIEAQYMVACFIYQPGRHPRAPVARHAGDKDNSLFGHTLLLGVDSGRFASVPYDTWYPNLAPAQPANKKPDA